MRGREGGRKRGESCLSHVFTPPLSPTLQLATLFIACYLLVPPTPPHPTPLLPPQLAKLSIACCRLREVPDGLAAVTSLRFLDLSFNELSDLPASLAKLSSLMALNLSFNPLKVGREGVIHTCVGKGEAPSGIMLLLASPCTYHPLMPSTI